MNKEVTVIRTPEIVAAEINSIKYQTRNIVLFNSIEIGRRLVEAKGMMDHGNFGDWLKSAVDYSQSTANNLMKIYDEYGSDQGALFGDNAKSQTLGNLTYSQAVALLGIPREEREAFVQENDVEALSVRKLQELVKEHELKLQAVEGKNKDLAEKAAQLNSRLKASDDQVADLKIKLSNAAEQAKNAQGDGAEALAKEKAELQRQLASAEVELKKLQDEANAPVTIETQIIEKVPEDILAELEALRSKEANYQKSAGALAFKMHFDALSSGFNELLSALRAIDDAETVEKYKGAVKKLLMAMEAKVE